MKIVHDGSRSDCTERDKDGELVTYTSDPRRITCDKCKKERA